MLHSKSVVSSQRFPRALQSTPMNGSIEANLATYSDKAIDVEQGSETPDLSSSLLTT